MTRTILLTSVLAVMLAAPDTALADGPDSHTAVASSLMTTGGAGPIASAAARHAVAHDPAFQSPGHPIATASRKGRVARKVVGAVAGGVGGFFLGGFLGAKLEPNCGCDDPGLKGFLIGAPIGAAAGAVLGAMVE